MRHFVILPVVAFLSASTADHFISPADPAVIYTGRCIALQSSASHSTVIDPDYAQLEVLGPIYRQFPSVARAPESRFSKLRGTAAPVVGTAFDFQNAGAYVTITNATYVYASVTQVNPSGAAFPVMNRLQVRVETLGDSPQMDHSGVINTLPGTWNYTLVGGLSASTAYAVGFVKISEPSWNEGDVNYSEYLIFNGFYTDGFVQRVSVPATTRRLEFIGDSLTAGYGVENVGPCAAHRYNSGWDVSWASLLCAQFNAACNTAAWSGKGLYVNNGNGYWAPRMPEIYTWNLGSDSSMGQWNFAYYTPDAVVINLGTNDYSTPFAQEPGFDGNFTAAYVAFMQNLTSLYYSKSTVIFAAVGPVTGDYYNSTAAAVQQAVSLGINAHLLDMRGAISCPGCVGCAGHPSAAGMTSMASAVQSTIASVMGW